MPEVNALAAKKTMRWVASGRFTKEAVASFMSKYGVAFPMLIDFKGEFSASVSANSTPGIYVFRPSKEKGKLDLIDSYSPFARGMGPIFLMRSNLEEPFKHFPGYLGSRVCASCHRE